MIKQDQHRLGSSTIIFLDGNLSAVINELIKKVFLSFNNI